MVDTINELSDLSRKLNQKSDQINSIIESINQKLLKLNLGFEAWVKDGDGVWLGYDKAARYRKDGNASVYIGEWQLVTRRDLTDGWSSESLLAASREVRVAGLKLVPQLLDALKEKATDMIATIEQAENSTEKL